MAEPSKKMDFVKELARGLEVHSTLQQEVLVTTSDKLRWCLHKHQRMLSDRKAFVAPLAILISLVASLVASDFRDWLFDKAVWKALFVLSTILTSVWLCLSLYRSLRLLASWREGTDDEIEAIVTELKLATPDVTAAVSNLDESGTDKPTTPTTNTQ